MSATKSKLAGYPELTLRTRAAWRQWLERNHATSRGVWFVHFKKASGEPGVGYDDCVEEALCFGWIDSTIRSLDETRYAHLLTPRSDATKWSELNRRRMEKLLAAGRVHDAGRAVYRHDPAPARKARRAATALPEFFAAALKRNARARRTFEGLAPSYRRHYIDWLAAAKRDDTRARRLAEALARLERGERLPLK